MTQERMVVVAETTSETDAGIILGYLQSEGIDATLSEDDAGDQLPALEMSRGVKILVREGEAARARELIAGKGGPVVEEED